MAHQTDKNVNDVEVDGDVAHDAVDAGNPVKIGGRASSTVPTAVASGDRVNGYFDTNGRLVILIGGQASGTFQTSFVLGATDHDAADGGFPIGVGHKAIAHGANPTAVAAADRTHWYANRAGVPWVIGGHPNVVTFRATYTAAQTDTAIVTIGTGNKIVVTRLSVTCDAANTNDTQARIGFGGTNTPTTTGVLLSHPGIAAGSGVCEGSGSGMLGVGADGEDLRITCEAPGGTIDVVVTYYTIES